MKNIFDSHAHYDDEAFDADRDVILSALPSHGICGVINCASSAKSCSDSMLLSSRYDFVWAACGIHPHAASEDGEFILHDSFVSFLQSEKCVAVGEIGLDYHYDFSPRDVQKNIFCAQLELAVELGLPVIVHDREAHEDTLTALKKYRPAGVMHCFSGSAEFATEVVKLGLYIGLGGAVTFKNAKKPLETAQSVPIERLLIETDCPYMSPVPFRGQRCTSALIPYTAAKIAEIKGVDTQHLLNVTADNTSELFGIKY